MTENIKGVSVSEPVTEKAKGKKRTRVRERIVYHVNAGHINDHLPTPQHAAAEGHQDVMEASCGKAAGNPVDAPDYNADRLSEPLTAGHAAPSTGDHGVGQGRNPEIAAHHPDLNQQTTTVFPWQTLRSFNGDNQFGDRDIVRPPGRAVVQQLQVRHPDQFTSQPSGNPNVRADHVTARNSATPPNGTHTVAGASVTSNAVSTKQLSNSEKLAEMRRALFG
jgi:hypothetical protein